jgi:erythronate-4-phosphate dehydrogenase
MKLIIDDAVQNYQKIFSDFGEITAVPGREINSQIVKDADVLIVRSRTQVNKTLLSGSNIKFVGSCVAGLDHIDETYLKQNNIAFFSAQGCNANAVAEYVMMTLLNLADELDFDLQKQSLGIIGVGNVGNKLLRKAKVFGMKVLLNDPIREQKENLNNFVNLETVLSADIITVHTPLTKTGDYPTLNLINQKHTSLLENKIVFNAARGGVIDENMWKNVSTKANIIDSWLNEPNIDTELQKNAYLATPHIAGHSIDAKLNGSYMIYEEMCKFFNKPKTVKYTDLIGEVFPITGGDNFKTVLNQIYDFQKDALAIKDLDNFEYYRRNYPLRYEWKHYAKEINGFLQKLITKKLKK